MLFFCSVGPDVDDDVRWWLDLRGLVGDVGFGGRVWVIVMMWGGALGSLPSLGCSLRASALSVCLCAIRGVSPCKCIFIYVCFIDYTFLFAYY